MAKSKQDRTIGNLKKASTFSTLSKKDLQYLSRLMTELHIPEGKVLTRQGARGSDFIIIVKGKAVVKRNNRKIAELGAGAFIGELAVISGEPRTATVEAQTDMVIKVLSRRELFSLMDKSPALAKNILIGAIKRLQALDKDKSKTN